MYRENSALGFKKQFLQRYLYLEEKSTQNEIVPEQKGLHGKQTPGWMKVKYGQLAKKSWLTTQVAEFRT